jgi:hypothetical protein
MTAETSNERAETYTFDMIEDAWGDAVPLTKPYFNRFRARLETLRQSAAPPSAAAQQQEQAAPPSAPVGVKTLSEFMAEQEALHPGIHDKVQAATDELRASLAQQPAAVDEGMVDRACDAYVQIADDCMGLVRRKAMRAALTAALATQHQEPTT